LVAADGTKEFIFSLAEIMNGELLKSLVYITTIVAGKKFVV
jgi:hypothetical protein